MSTTPTDPLEPFSAATRRWFTGAFGAPTAAQEGAWQAISRAENTLIIAPTGSGKTLAAFLWALDTLHREKSNHTGKKTPGTTRILYISPLKALGADVERNLRAPLAGIARTAAETGATPPEITVGVRSGDTPARERRQLVTNPPDILITTPESLYLMLTSAARATLTDIHTVIVDEIHAIAGTKRGAHLAVSLERLDQILPQPAQRIGLSATVDPPEAVAQFLGGTHPVTIIAREVPKRWQLKLSVPVPDLAALGGANDYGQGSYAPTENQIHKTPPGGHSTHTLADAVGIFDGEEGVPIELPAPERVTKQPGTSGSHASIWPHVQERIVDEIENNRSTIVFVNSRGLAEKLTAALNDIHARREHARRSAHPEPHHTHTTHKAGGTEPESIPPLARAHHGSVSKDQRTLIEEALKNGTLRCVVATSSLELGIDMGHVDLVIQVSAPPSVAAGLQRVGRAGHHVGEISRGCFYPKHRGDLLSSAVTLAGMLAGSIEPLSIPTNPLDVLAQQTVAVCALAPIGVEAWYRALKRTAPFANLPRTLFDNTLEMLAGRYPSDEFAELRPRIIWDRTATEEHPAGTLEGRPGAQRLAVTSGGTIPDRGLFPVYLGESGESASPKRVGELDEEMVYESRSGDVITLGASSWRIEEITHDAVRVSPAPGEHSRLPFWLGERNGRPVALGARMGRFTRELAANTTGTTQNNPAKTGRIRAELEQLGLDTWAADNLIAYVQEQVEATGAVPSDTRFIIECFRDELGDWRIILHSPYGYPVHAPWALAVSARVAERYGVDASALAADDGIVLRIPDTGQAPDSAELFLFDPDELEALVTERVGDSALFAARFRESAARALLLPRRDPGKRTPLWQQRQRSAQLLQVARKYPDFPILLETARECLHDVYDVPALVQLHRDIAARRITITQVHTPAPSPFARTLLFEYVADHIYDTDAPAAERRAAALSLDPALLAELLGSVQLRELLDTQVILQVQQRLQRTGAPYRAHGVEGVADLLRQLGPLTAAELAERLHPEEPQTRSAHGGVSRETLGSDALANPTDPGCASVQEAKEAAPVEHASAAYAQQLAQQLVASGRAFTVPCANAPAAGKIQLLYAAVEDAARLRDGLGLPLPSGIARAHLTGVAAPLEDLVSRYARTHIPFTAADAAAHLSRITPVGAATVLPILRELERQNRVLAGQYLPEELQRERAGAAAFEEPASQLSEWVDTHVLGVLRARSLAALRRDIEPVSAQTYGMFLPAWQHVRTLPVTVSQLLPEAANYGAYYEPERTARIREATSEQVLEGREGLLSVIDQLAGVRVPASALETLILPGRVKGYGPQLLDGLLASGEVLWCGAGQMSGSDGWVSLHLRETAELTLPSRQVRAEHLAELGPIEQAVCRALAAGGLFFGSLYERTVELLRNTAPDGTAVRVPDTQAVSAALWRLVWDGVVTNDTFAPVRAVLAGGVSAHPVPATKPAARMVRRRGAGRLASARAAVAGGAAYPRRYGGLAPGAAPAVAGQDTGRFCLVTAPDSPGEGEDELDATVAAYAHAELLLDRYGVLTRGALAGEDTPGGFAALYRVYTAAEERALVRRGYFIEGLGAAQFAAPATVDVLRSYAPGTTGDTGAARRTGNEQVFGSFAGVLLAATDPANPYGAALQWPQVPSLLPGTAAPAQGSPSGGVEPGGAAGQVRHRPGRKAGACVVLLDGKAVLYVERGGKTLLTFTTDPLLVEAAAPLLARIVQAGAAQKMVIEKVNDVPILDTPAPLNAAAVEHPVVALRRALLGQGFYSTPRGVRMRRNV